MVGLLLVGGSANGAEPIEASGADGALSAQRIERLVRQLGDADYFARQRAQDDLAQLGFEAFDALSAGENDPDAEIAARAKYLLKLMRMNWAKASDPPAVKRHLTDYETLTPSMREEKMNMLAALPDGQGADALCRLVRCERSTLLSKAAALIVLGWFSGGPAPHPAAVEAIRRNLDGCKRSGALWLSAWSRLNKGSDSAMKAFDALIREEQSLLKQSPAETDAKIVSGLIRIESLWLKKFDRMEEAASAVERLVEIESGDPETLSESLVWLIDQKAWKAVDQLTERFSKRIGADAGLLYLLAEAQASQGATDRAEETADRAFALQPGRQDEQLLQHLNQAKRLRKRGRFDWARREFEHVAERGNVMRYGVETRSQLADMLHDQGRDSEAADVVEKLLRRLEKFKMAAGEWKARGIQAIESRMNFYQACHWKSQNDLPKQRESLDRALKVEMVDVDALIACYRLPDQSSEYRAGIVDRIQRMTAQYREELANYPGEVGEAGWCNMLAWLIGNTEGDLDFALECAKKAVEMNPGEGAIRDTLARVHYARGELETALAEQMKAAELEPHSGLIRRQLDSFRKAVEEKGAVPPR